MEGLHIHDIHFLYGVSQPTIALIHQNKEEDSWPFANPNGPNPFIHQRHLKTYELSLEKQKFTKVGWKLNNVDQKANMLIAVPEPYRGVIILGPESITYHNGASHHTIAPPNIQESNIVAYARIDLEGWRYLLGDMAGNLFVCQRKSAEEDKRANLSEVGRIHLGACLNVFRQGSLVVNSLGDSSIPHTDSILFGKWEDFCQK